MWRFDGHFLMSIWVPGAYKVLWEIRRLGRHGYEREGRREKFHDRNLTCDGLKGPRFHRGRLGDDQGPGRKTQFGVGTAEGTQRTYQVPSHNYCPERMFDKCESGEKVPRDSQGLVLGWPGQEHPGQRRRTDGRTGNRKGQDYRPAGEKQEELV